MLLGRSKYLSPYTYLELLNDPRVHGDYLEVASAVGSIHFAGASITRAQCEARNSGRRLNQYVQISKTPCLSLSGIKRSDRIGLLTCIVILNPLRIESPGYLPHAPHHGDYLSGHRMPGVAAADAVLQQFGVITPENV